MNKVFLLILLLASAASAVAQDSGFLIRVNQDVNLRLEPDIEAQRWGTAGAGNVLHVIGQSNGWYEILLDGKYEGEVVWLASWLDLSRLDISPPLRPIPQPTPTAYSPSFDFHRIYQESLPSVVMLNTVDGGGTGFVIDKRGHIVTNAHVVDDNTWAQVEFYGGEFARGTVLGVDERRDIAVLRVDIPCEQLHPISFITSENLAVGQPVLAIGGPGSLSWDAATGHIEELNAIRTLDDGSKYAGLIASDFRTAPGYSGGPLIDTRGEVIGVTFAGGDTTALSIPASQALPLVREIIGNLSASIEIPVRSLDLQTIERFGLYEYASGVLVTLFDDGETFQKYGLFGHYETGDSASADEAFYSEYSLRYVYSANIIYSVNGERVTNQSNISRQFKEACPGEVVNLNIYDISIFHREVDIRATFTNANEIDSFLEDSIAIPLGSLDGAEAYISGVKVLKRVLHNLPADVESAIVVGINSIPVQDNIYGLREYMRQRLGQEVTLNLLFMHRNTGEKIVPITVPERKPD